MSDYACVRRHTCKCKRELGNSRHMKKSEIFKAHWMGRPSIQTWQREICRRNILNTIIIVILLIILFRRLLCFLSVCILFFILLISVYFELYWWCEDIYDVVVLLISFLLLVSHNFRWHFLQKKKKREEFWGHKQTQIIIYYLPVRLSRPIQNCNTYKHSKNKRSTWPFTLFKIFK